MWQGLKYITMYIVCIHCIRGSGDDFDVVVWPIGFNHLYQHYLQSHVLWVLVKQSTLNIIAFTKLNAHQFA